MPTFDLCEKAHAILTHPIDELSKSEREAQLQRANVLALQIDSPMIFPFGESVDDPTPVVYLNCPTHGRVLCTKLLCLMCSRTYAPSVFILVPQCERRGETVTVPNNICACGIEHLTAECELCEPITKRGSEL